MSIVKLAFLIVEQNLVGLTCLFELDLSFFSIILSNLIGMVR